MVAMMSSGTSIKASSIDVTGTVTEAWPDGIDDGRGQRGVVGAVGGGAGPGDGEVQRGGGRAVAGEHEGGGRPCLPPRRDRAR